ncbi:MAG: sigma-70 family RNA polymerase sigma factor [Deltaproteobacteria bacterium]|nr:sigma-70 family RNA polymerase sigma factor [Deltaproteobacteria bacterium]
MTGTPPEHTRELTQLLRAWRGGSQEAEAELWPILYRELKGLARAVLRGRRHSAGPQTTTLVHEACLRLMGSEVDWNDRRHFFAVAARAMRFVLVDEARHRLAQKRGAEQGAGELAEEVIDPATLRSPEVLAVHQALDRLGEINPRHVKMVELRYFAGLSLEETADVLEVSRPTVVRDWRAARVWLHGQLQPTAPL